MAQKRLTRAWLAAVIGVLVLGWPADARAQLGRTSPVTVSTAWSIEGAAPGDQVVLAVVLDIQPPYHANPDASRIPAEFDFLIPTTLEPTRTPADLKVGAVQYPDAHDVEVAYAGSPQVIKAYEGRTVLYVPVLVPNDAALGDRTVELSLTYQTCDDKTCLPPVTKSLQAVLTIVPAEQRTVHPDTDLFRGFDLTAFAALLEGARAPEHVRFDLFGWELTIDAASGLGLTALLGMAAIGGLLLNFTPCVLPVIPIKIMGLARDAGNRARCLVLGVFMALGVIGFWLGLGVAIASVTGFTATNQLFQYPWFTIGVGVVIAIMSVGMCGFFAVQLPQVVYQVTPRHDTVAGSFGFGVMTAVLSTPCTAPFMGAAAAWAATQAASTTFRTFAAIGVGMALPYLVLAAFPQLVARVPRTGPGNELLKQVMGLLMLAAAAYFVGVGISGLVVSPPDPPTRLHWWPVVGFIALAGLWLAWRMFVIRTTTTKRVAFAMVGLVMAVGSIYAGVRVTDRGPIDWTYYTPERFENAKAAGQVVVMDFTAEWCLNCKALEHSVLYDPRVARLLREPGVTPIKVDLTGNNPAGNAMLKSAGRVAIPLLVVFNPAGEAVFTSDFYTVEQVVEAVNAARHGG